MDAMFKPLYALADQRFELLPVRVNPKHDLSAVAHRE
jgi:hypothetical protein